VVGVGGVPDDALVLFVEGVHRTPGEADPVAQFVGVLGQGKVLPGATGRGSVAGGDAEPGSVTQFAMRRGAVLVDENPGSHIVDREERHRVVTGLVQQQHVLAVGDPLPGESDAHAPTQRLGEQQPLR
jgi:hypothetical protein